MKRIRLAILPVICLIGFSACAPQPAQVPSATPGSTAEPSAEAMPAAAKLAEQALADELNMDMASITVVQAVARDWPDPCLGVPRPDELCAAVMTPGYEITLQANGETYLYRTDLSGETIRRAPQAPAAEIEGPLHAARLALSEVVGLSPDDFELVSYEAVDWPDACLGVAQPGVMCAAVITPGYKLVLRASGNTYVVHTDLSGGSARIAAGVEDVEPVAQAAARQALAGRLGIDPASVEVLSAQKTTWPDACLGLAEDGELCSAVQTPGYQVTLWASGEQFVYRTDLAGRSVRAEPSAAQGQSELAIGWRLTGETCQRAAVSFDENVTYGSCSSQPANASLGQVNPARLEEFAELAGTYAAFSAETRAGKVDFNGYGAQTATAAEQRSIAEWMRRVVRELNSGGDNAALGLVLVWRREGGIAGFCDDLTVSVDGYAAASSCHGAQPRELGRVRLSATQLEWLYAWNDLLQPFEAEHTDPATADAMTVRLTFAGSGKNTASEAEKTDLLDFAQEVWNQAGVPAADGDLPAAQDALLRFFDLLNAGRYSDTAGLYLGSYAFLAGANPDLRPINPAELLEAGCTRNGLVCMKVQEVIDAQAISANRFQFSVTFANPDGSQFVLGPCCGASATEQPPVSQFEIIVRKTAGEYKVTALPPYVP